MSNPRVLIAEDDDSMRRALERQFKMHGFTVDAASNYCDVRDLLDAHDYDVIVSDNRMPLSPGSQKADSTCGLQLLAFANLHPRLKDVPFVLHTSDNSVETQRLVREFGGVYREKNSPGTTIVEFCRQLLNR